MNRIPPLCLSYPGILGFDMQVLDATSDVEIIAAMGCRVNACIEAINCVMDTIDQIRSVAPVSVPDDVTAANAISAPFYTIIPAIMVQLPTDGFTITYPSQGPTAPVCLTAYEFDGTNPSEAFVDYGAVARNVNGSLEINVGAHSGSGSYVIQSQVVSAL